MKPEAVNFDNALEHFVRLIRDENGIGPPEDGVFFRDSSGRLGFVSSLAHVADDLRAAVEQRLRQGLGEYGRSENIVLFGDDPGAERLFNDETGLLVEIGDKYYELVDKRVVGAGWLESPTQQLAFPPRIVFASIKGGVGRSTAIAIAAADLARRNKNVLVVDLDLEAPGIGALLLDDERLPSCGVLDFLVQNGLAGVGDEQLSEFVGTSALTTGDGGRVDVLPAIGSRSIKYPVNILAKLARSMINDYDETGFEITVRDQISDMLDRITSLNSYDVVLVDSRAGMSELAAPAVLGLGATVLLFGTDQRQTIEGYRSMFASLKLLALRDRYAGKSADWRLQLKAVYAKANFDDDGRTYVDDLYEVFADNLYDAQEEDGLVEDAISFDIDDESAPHWPLVIPFNSAFSTFDPVKAPKQLLAPFYEQSFRPFLDGLDALIEQASSSRSSFVGD